MSPDPDTRVRPSGKKATPVMADSCPSNVAIAAPDSAAQRRIVLSAEPEATIVPSGLKATLVTQCAWPLSVARGSAVAADQRRTVLSLEPEAIMRPLAEKAMVPTRLAWPLSMATSAPVFEAIMQTVPSHAPAAMMPPPGEKTTEREWPFQDATFSPLSMDHRRTTPSPVPAGKKRSLKHEPSMRIKTGTRGDYRARKEFPGRKEGLPAMSARPSGENATECDVAVSVAMTSPVSVDHSRMVLSEDADATTRPSGEKATLRTSPP